jgi:hypothetical protein
VSDPARACPPDEVLVGLALGELTGRERADALEHVMACHRCREEVEALTATAEQALLAGPVAEPPPGFESAVLARLDESRPAPRHPRRRSSLWLVAAAAAVLLIGIVAGGLLVRGSSPEVAEAAMLTPTGRDVGAAWRYDETPGWVFVSVPEWQVWEDPAGEPHRYRLEATLSDGTTMDLGPADFATTDGSWGTTLSVEPAQVQRVAVVDEDGRSWCEGTF